MFLEIATAALTIGSLIKGEESRSAQRKAMRLDEARREREAKRQQIQQLRQGMVQRAQIIAAGAATGTMESSAVQGGAGSVGSQVASNLSFMNQIQGINEGIQRQNIKAQESAGQAQALGSIAGIAGSFIK